MYDKTLRRVRPDLEEYAKQVGVKKMHGYIMPGININNNMVCIAGIIISVKLSADNLHLYGNGYVWNHEYFTDETHEQLIDEYIAGKNFTLTFKDIDDIDDMEVSGIIDKLVDKKVIVSSTLYDLFTEFEHHIDPAKLAKLNIFSLAASDNQKISYYTPDRYGRIKSDNIFDYYEKRKDNAYMAKPGKVFKKICKDETPQEVVSKFSDRFNTMFGKGKLKLEDAERIPELYDGDNYHDEYDGSLGSSCMKDMDSEVFEVYADNCKGMLVLWKNDKVAGRALVWNVEILKLHNKDDITFEIPKAQVFMDRIYTNDSKDVDMFIEYAKKQGWMYKYQQSFDSHKAFIYKDQRVDASICTKLKHINYEYMPYMDTLSYLNPNNNTLNNSNHRGTTKLRSTDGSFTRSICSVCGEAINNNNRYEHDGEMYCSDCFYENFSYCEHCGEHCPIEDSIYIVDRDEYVCLYCADNDYFKCDDCGEYSSETTYGVEGKEVCANCLENYSVCDNCGEFCSETYVAKDGEYLCSDCADNAMCSVCGEIDTTTHKGMCDTCREEQETEDTEEQQEQEEGGVSC